MTDLLGKAVFFHKSKLYFQTFERGEAEYGETRVQGHLTRQKGGVDTEMGGDNNYCIGFMFSSYFHYYIIFQQ